jgi:hypothetical protein
VKQSVVFKEWLPDQPDLGPECLITAKNTLASPAGYRPFKTLDTSMGTMAASAVAGVIVSGGANKTDSDIYATDGSTYYVSNSGGQFTARGTNTAGADIMAYAQFDNLIIAFGQEALPRKHTLNSTSNFSTLAALGTAPSASVVGVINRFLVAGNLGTTGSTATTFPNGLQWSAIDDPTNWPTPDSATATATQSGFQLMDSRYGYVTGIHGGDQFGVVLQTGAVSRMTYVGPPVVFQFDTISNDFGSLFRRASVKAGPHTYFISKAGFCRTDGVSVERIGAGKVDRFFWDAVWPLETQIMAAYDPINKQVSWAYPTSVGSASTCNRMLSFNTDTSSWTYADVTLESLVTPGGGALLAASGTAMAFNSGASSCILGKFQATAGSAVFETSDTEFNPGGRAYVDGIKPQVESSGTAPSMTMRVGYRDDLGTAPSYTAATSATSATGFADFRADARYHRAELTITGNFDRATGLIARIKTSGER